MNNKLTTKMVGDRLATLREAMILEECLTCECMQGFLTQLEIDAAEEVTELTTSFKVTRAEMHPCLGCDPCPPADLFAEYLRAKEL
jgi:hypothetical protein